MATYKILYWQEVPSQIQAEDEQDEVKLQMSPRFMALIDQLAMQRGLEGADEFLAEWNWGEEQEREGERHLGHSGQEFPKCPTTP